MNSKHILAAFAALTVAGGAIAAGADLGNTQKQATNWTAIVMFAIFVFATLWITKWAASKTKTAADFYTAGGGITGFQNGLAIAGDYMSAASFLGISGLVFANGFDGLIFSIGWLVGWPSACATWASSPSPTSPPTASPRCRCVPSRRSRLWLSSPST